MDTASAPAAQPGIAAYPSPGHSTPQPIAPSLGEHLNMLTGELDRLGADVARLEDRLGPVCSPFSPAAAGPAAGAAIEPTRSAIAEHVARSVAAARDLHDRLGRLVDVVDL